MDHVTASHIYFIKLGPGGEWEQECLRDGVLRFGYREARRAFRTRENWDDVWNEMFRITGNRGATSNHVRQFRTFLAADEDTIFITFISGLLYWCRPSGPIEMLNDDSHRRATIDGWHNTSIGGTILSADNLSGHLLKVQMYQGTICKVDAAAYLLRKLNDQPSPEAAAALLAEQALIKAIVAMMRHLTWQDFELLVDLVFSGSGWRRVGQLGRAQKTVDIEMVLPSTNERAFVQVKSAATAASLADYVAQLTQAQAYDRMFFVWHSGDISDDLAPDNVSLLGPARLARMVLDAGLSSWLRGKVG